MFGLGGLAPPSSNSTGWGWGGVTPLSSTCRRLGLVAALHLPPPWTYRRLGLVAALDFPPPWTFRRLGLKDNVKKIKDLAKLKDLCGKGNAWTPRAGDHGRKGLTNEITRG